MKQYFLSNPILNTLTYLVEACKSFDEINRYLSTEGSLLEVIPQEGREIFSYAIKRNWGLGLKEVVNITVLNRENVLLGLYKWQEMSDFKMVENEILSNPDRFKYIKTQDNYRVYEISNEEITVILYSFLNAINKNEYCVGIFNSTRS